MKVKESTLRIGVDAIFPMLLSMTIPGLMGTMTNYLYRTIDQIFVGNYVGRNALGGISVLAPFNNVNIALMLFLTVGGASQLSLAMGEQNYSRANKLFTNIVAQAVIMAAFSSLTFYFMAAPFVHLCGVKEGTEVYEYALSYLKIVTFGQVFLMLNQGLAAVIRSEGSAKYAMASNMIGAVCNVFLDWLLIGVVGMGIEGAAYATVGSQFIGSMFSISYFALGKSSVRWQGMKALQIKEMLTITKMGIAPSVFQMLAFTANILINKSLQYYGDLDPIYRLIGGGELCISAVSVVNTVDGFIVSATAGVNQAVAPVLGYNYGARKYDRVRKASLTAQMMAFSMAIIIWGFMMLVPEFVVSLFSNNDSNFIEYGAMAMRTSKLFALFTGYQMLVSMYFSSIGKPQIATLVSFSRNGIFLIPALIILPKYFGLTGVLYANAVSDGCSLLVVSFLYIKEMFRLKTMHMQLKTSAE